MMLADAVDRDRLVATFLELVAIDSPTGHGEDQPGAFGPIQ
jgi:tripeptide aminopeptidase